MLLLTSCTAGITGILFAIFFLRIAYYYKTFVFSFFDCYFSFFVAIVSTIAGNNQLGYKVIDYAQLAGGVLLILISFLIGRKGYNCLFLSYCVDGIPGRSHRNFITQYWYCSLYNI
jgi:hypothetical protein